MRRQCQFARISFPALPELIFTPTQHLQFFGDNAFGSGQTGFHSNFTGLVFTLHISELVEQFLPEFLTAKTPAAPDLLESRCVLVLFGLSPRLQPALKLRQILWCVLSESVRSQQPIDPEPNRAMSSCGGRPAKAAPRITRDPIFRFQQFGPDRVQMRGINAD